MRMTLCKRGGLVIQTTLIATACAVGFTASKAYSGELNEMRQELKAHQFEGKVEPRVRAFVTNAVNGVLTDIHFQPGDQVEQGQLLFQLSSASHQHQVEAAEALVQRRKVELDMAWTNAERSANLGERGAISEIAVQDAANALALAEAALQEAIANKNYALTGYNATQITAPISGKIGAPSFEVGTYLKTETGQTLAKVVQTDPMLIKYDQPYSGLLALYDAAPEKVANYFNRIAVKVTLPSGTQLAETGRILSTNNVLDSEGNVQVWAEMPNPDGVLVSGLPVTVTLALEEKLLD